MKGLPFRWGTPAWIAVAVGAIALTWYDPWGKGTDPVPMMSNRSAARRLFPDLPERDVARATIELQARDGPLVRLVPSGEGPHQLMRGDELLGPVDPDALDGIWASLGMATTLRAVSKGTDTRAGQRGVIRLAFPDATKTLELGRAAPDESGLYGAILEEGGGAWVVEQELAWLVDQPAEAWLARRVSLREVDEVTGVSWGQELGIARLDDDLWRVTAGAEPALLSTNAVLLRLRRLLQARLDPMVPREQVAEESLRPWLVLTGGDGRTDRLVAGGECPGEPDKRLVDRGPGLLGCLPSRLLDPWPLGDPDASFLEPRLLPHSYGAILSVEQTLPAPQTLRRDGRRWILDGGAEGAEPFRVEVPDDEVYRWYSTLQDVDVETVTAQSLADQPFLPDVELTFNTDANMTLRLRCQLAEDLARCARDDAAPRALLGTGHREIAFSAETFEDRQLVSVPVSEVRALEILPAEGSKMARQSVHLDLGSWRLDAPEHPDADGALDQVRLEALLSAFASLRAQSWAEPTPGPALRTLELELMVKEGRDRSVSVTLHEDCVAQVSGHRPARLTKSACAALSDDLLYVDPLRYWIEGARSLDYRLGTADPVVLRRAKEGWTDAEGVAVSDDVRAQLSDWSALRSAGLRRGAPEGTPVARLSIRRDQAASVEVEVGRGWVRVAGRDWYYETTANPEQGNAVDAPEPSPP